MLPMKKLMPLALLLTLAACNQAATPESATKNAADSGSKPIKDPIAPKQVDINLEEIIKAAMNQQYGANYNAKYDCWNYVLESDDNSASYCMKPGEAHVMNVSGGKVIDFYAANRADISDNLDYGYGQVDSGLMGAFKLSVNAAGEWKYTAANKAMSFGSAGYCGCDKAELVKLSNEGLYGWMFSSGGVWQGIIVLDHEILAPNGDTFENISSIPEVREDTQDTKYEIKVVDTAAGKSVFPLLVTKLTSGKKDKELLINFDDKKRIYVLPENF